MTEEELRNLANYKESKLFGTVEQLVLDLAVSMTRTPAVVSDDLFNGLRKHFTESQLVELTTEIAFSNYRGRFNRAFLCRPADFSKGAFCPMPE